MAGTFGEFSVYQVEVCRSCSWNHLVASFVMGKAGEQLTAFPSRRSLTVARGKDYPGSGASHQFPPRTRRGHRGSFRGPARHRRLPARRGHSSADQ